MAQRCDGEEKPPELSCRSEMHSTTCVLVYVPGITLSESNKLPVRRRSHPNPTRTLELVKHTLEQFALVCYDVEFTLDNLAVNRNNLRKGRVLSIPKASRISISWISKLIETAERLRIRRIQTYLRLCISRGKHRMPRCVPLMTKL